MPDFAIAFIVAAVSLPLSERLFRWAGRILKRSGKKEFGYVRDGGIQVVLGITAAFAGLIALAVGFAEL